MSKTIYKILYLQQSRYQKLCILKIPGRSEQLGYVGRHLHDLGGVESLNLSQGANVVVGNEVDGNTLSTETTTSTDSVDVVLLVAWQVVVDNQGDLLDIDTSGQKVGGDQDSQGTGSELLHDGVSDVLGKVGVDRGHSELSGTQLLSQELNLSSGVAENHSLGDGDGVVKVHQAVKLVLFLLNVDVKLLDTFKGQLVLLDQDSHRVAHELGGDLKHIQRHGGQQKDNLQGLRQQGENVVDLFFETGRKHLIGLVKNEHLDLVGSEHTAVNHVVNTAWSTHNNLSTALESVVVGSGGSTSDTSVHSDVQVHTEGHHNLLDLQRQLSGWSKNKSLGCSQLWVNSLQSRNGKGGGLTGTRLRLRKHIIALDDWQNGTLLNRRWGFETVTENTTEDFRLEVQLLEGVNDVVVVGLDLARVHFGDSVRHGDG